MAEDLTRLVKIVRDQLVQQPLPPQAKLAVGTLTVNDEIKFSPAALAALKKLLGL